MIRLFVTAVLLFLAQCAVVRSEPALPDAEPQLHDWSLVQGPPPPTVRDLCEPLGERWSPPSKKERRVVVRTIRRTCRAMGVSRNSCKYFILIGARESMYNASVRHRLPGDVRGAGVSWRRLAHRFGWHLERGGASGISLQALSGPRNPYYVDVARWSTGLGLGGLNPANAVIKFDPYAPPEILCDPVINVMSQIEIARSAVVKYNARNFYEVQAVYGGRTYKSESGKRRALSCSRGCPDVSDRLKAKARKFDAKLRIRCESVGMDCYRRPRFGTVLVGGTIEDRYRLASDVRGAPLPVFDSPPLSQETVTEIFVNLR